MDNNLAEEAGGSKASLQLPFTGREQQISQFLDAFNGLSSGVGTNFLVHGVSGVGRRSLVQRFLGSLPVRDEVLVAQGRYYECGSRPYEAFEEVLGDLAAYLEKQPRPDVEKLLPDDIEYLTQIFPVLSRVGSIAERLSQLAVPQLVDTQELQRRAFQALRELLFQVASRTKFVVVFHDLQWGNMDCGLLLSELTCARNPPPLLVIGICRSEDMTSPNLRPLFDGARHGGTSFPWRGMSVDPLSTVETRSLLMSLLGGLDFKFQGEIDRYVQQTSGIPFLVRELLNCVHEGIHFPDQPDIPVDSRIDQLLQARLARLPKETRSLLEIIAVAGRPIAIRDLELAVGESYDPEAFASLKAQYFIRTTGGNSAEIVECYHDRTRRAVLANCSANSRLEHHRGWADVISPNDATRVDEFAFHCQAMGDGEKASRACALAGTSATQRLAFTRSAEYFQSALRWAGLSASETRKLHICCADALANAGKGAESAQEYLAAIEGAGAAERLDLLRRAAMQSLINGHIDQGLNSVRTLLQSLGMKIPKSPLGALLSLQAQRLRLRFRGLKFTSRPESQVPAELLAKIDGCLSAAVALEMVDPIRACCFVAKGLLLALDAGEPSRVARGLAMEAAHEVILGSMIGSAPEKLLELAESMARRSNSSSLDGLLLLAKGHIAYVNGQFRQASDLCEEAGQVFRGTSSGVTWERDSVRIVQLWSQRFLGEFGLLANEVPVFLRDADRRGDAYAGSTIGIALRVETRLAADDMEEARRELSEHLRRRSQQGFNVQDFSAFIAQVYLYLYSGDNLAAWRFACEQRQSLLDSLIIRVPIVRTFATYLHGHCALAAAAAGDAGKNLCATAERNVGRLMAEGADWARPLAIQLQAGTAACRGQSAQAQELFERAAQEFEKNNMALYSAVSRRRSAELATGNANRVGIESADQWMIGQSIKDPARFSYIMAPPLPRLSV